MAQVNNPALQKSKTLWIGDTEAWMDEEYIASIFAATGTVSNVKVIRDKITGMPSGYGFVEFSSHDAAQQALLAYNGKQIPGTNKTLKLNWGVLTPQTKTASAGPGSQPNANMTLPGVMKQQPMMAPTPQVPEHSIYVGELAPSVDEAVLIEYFGQRYKSVSSSKIVVDPVTRVSKGFGFVNFTDAGEAAAAIKEMRGGLLRGRAIKTGPAHMKNAATNNAANLNVAAASLMLNPLLAMVNPLAANPYGMGTAGAMGMAGYGDPNLQSMYQGAYAGMAGVATTPTVQTLGYAQPTAQGLGANATFTYSSQAGVAGQTPQNAYQTYQQAQPTATFTPHGYSTAAGYGTDTTVQTVQATNPYYQQQVGAYYTQPGVNAYQQYAGYAAPQVQQVQVGVAQQQYLPTQQAGYQYMATAQPQMQPQAYQWPQQQQQQQVVQAGYQKVQAPQPPMQKAPSPSMKPNPVAPPPVRMNERMNNPPPPKSQTITIPFLNQGVAKKMEPPMDKKMEEEKGMQIEESMVYNPNYIESNFKFDFIGSGKMRTML